MNPAVAELLRAAMRISMWQHRRKSPSADSNTEIANQFHELLRSLSSNNTPDIAGGLQEVERTISLCGNITVARAAFNSAKAIFPSSRWMLLWGAYVVDDTALQHR